MLFEADYLRAKLELHHFCESDDVLARKLSQRI